MSPSPSFFGKPALGVHRETYQTVKNSSWFWKNKQTNLFSVDLLWGTFCFRETYKREKDSKKHLLNNGFTATTHTSLFHLPFSTVLSALWRYIHRGVARLRMKARREKKRAAFPTAPSAVHEQRESNISAVELLLLLTRHQLALCGSLAVLVNNLLVTI